MIKFIYTIFIFLREDIFIKTSIETNISQIVLDVIFRAKTKLMLFSLSKINMDLLWKMFTTRLRILKVQILSCFQLNKFCPMLKKFPILKKPKLNFFFIEINHYFHKSLSWLPKSYENKKNSFYYLKTKTKLNFINIWKIF